MRQSGISPPAAREKRRKVLSTLPIRRGRTSWDVQVQANGAGGCGWATQEWLTKCQ